MSEFVVPMPIVIKAEDRDRAIRRLQILLTRLGVEVHDAGRQVCESDVVELLPGFMF